MAGGESMLTIGDIKSSEEVKTFLSIAETQMRVLGYTEHSFRHVALVSETAGKILKKLGYPEREVEMAKIAGFQQWAAARGVPVTKSTQCLTDENSVNQLVQMTSDATTQYPDFAGTPTFVLNDKMLEKTATWELLEPQLRSALGG
jgi:hypothetical protein